MNPPFHLLPLPAFKDNYIWLLHNGKQALVVDPGDAAPVQEALAHHGLILRAMLLTHHHADHVGGVAALRQATDAAVFGPAREPLPEPVTRMTHDSTVDLLGLRFTVIAVPGHTAGHVAYYGQAAGQPVLFCGDTLFSGGCGRLFEGTPAQMQASLDALAALPDDTLVCCAHEYTLANLRFAQAVEPDNAPLAQYLRQCQQLRDNQQPTLPATLGVERAINPFLRTRHSGVAAAARRFDAQVNPQDPVSVLAALRQWKNSF